MAQDISGTPVGKYTLAKVVAPRVGDKTLAATGNLISAVSREGDILSLEMVGTEDGVSLMHRADRDDPLFKRMAQAHFPAAVIEEAPPDDDPLIPGPDEDAWTQTLRVEGEPYLPLHTVKADDLQAAHGADPMVAVVGAHSGLDAHERVVSRLVLKPLPDDWSEKYKPLGFGGAGSHNATLSIEEQREKNRSRSPREDSDDSGTRGMNFFGRLAVVALLVGFLIYRWISGLSPAQQSGAIALLITLLVVVGAGAVVWWRRRREETVDDYVNPDLVRQRIEAPAYEVEIQITYLANRHVSWEGHARLKLDSVVQAFRHYNHPQGSRLVAGEIRRHTAGQSLMSFAEPEPEPGLFGFLKKEEPLDSVIGLHEVASMWHLPTKGNTSNIVKKLYGYNIAPPREMMTVEGAYVGNSTTGPPVEIHFSDEMLRQHQFVIARTGMGKSTFIEHCVAYKLEQKALGQNDEAIVVVDPHSDLINSLLELTPPSLREKVWLIDLADEEHVPGINVLDAHIFPDRDHTVDGLIRIAKGTWDKWGGRMQNILEHTLKCLHEANSHKDTKREEQYTLLDASRMLNDKEYRAKVMERVDDVFLKRYWRDEFDKMPARLRGEAIAPVQTRLDYFASSKRLRGILGQRQSTLDIRAAIENGDVIFVNTAQGAVGRDVAALVGGSILNLLDAVVRQQGRKPEDQRRAVYIVVDEMQTIPGVNFQGMLREVRKVGGSVCLVTQSLAALDEVSDTMADQVMANISQLIVFQVAGEDARRLADELGRQRVSVSDMISLPAHHAYVRMTTSTLTLPTFSMSLREPQERNESWGRGHRARCSEYTNRFDEIEAQFRDDYKMPDIEPDPTTGHTGVDGGVPYIDSGNFMRPHEGGGQARGRRRRSRSDSAGHDDRDAERRDTSQSDDNQGGTAGRRRPTSPRDSNIQRFDENR